MLYLKFKLSNQKTQFAQCDNARIVTCPVPRFRAEAVILNYHSGN